MYEGGVNTPRMYGVDISNLECMELIYYSAGKRDRGKRHPQEEGGEAPRLHRTGGEAPCSMKGRKTRREENVFKGVENLPALLYTIV